jgi:hypothetical protein
VKTQPPPRTTISVAAASQKNRHRLRTTRPWVSSEVAKAQTPSAVPPTAAARRSWTGTPVTPKNASMVGQPGGTSGAAGRTMPAAMPYPAMQNPAQASAPLASAPVLPLRREAIASVAPAQKVAGMARKTRVAASRFSIPQTSATPTGSAPATQVSQRPGPDPAISNWDRRANSNRSR